MASSKDRRRWFEIAHQRLEETLKELLVDCAMVRLEWTHESTTCPTGKGCLGSTQCGAFPTIQDRVNHARRAFEAYAEADGTSFDDFLLDVALLTLADCSRPATRWSSSMRTAKREVRHA